MDSEPSSVEEELLPVVDERDRIVGIERRGVIHARELLHRAVHIILVDDLGRVYLQRRSWEKDSAPGKWDSSCSGHVDAGESYDEAAIRELMEELGIESQGAPRRVGKLTASAATGMEFSTVYTMQTASEPVPDPREIIEGRWADPLDLDDWIERFPSDFAECFLQVWEHCRERIFE